MFMLTLNMFTFQNKNKKKKKFHTKICFGVKDMEKKNIMKSSPLIRS